MPSLPPWRRPDNFSVIAHQRIVDALNPLTSLDAIGDLLFQQTPRSTTLIDERRYVYFYRGLAALTAPEDTDHTYAGPQYRATALYAADAGTDAAALPTLPYEDAPADWPEGGLTIGGSDPVAGPTVTATNLAEAKRNPADGTLSGTHLLAEDGSVAVEIFGIYDRHNPQLQRYFFSFLPPSTVLFTATGTSGADTSFPYVGTLGAGTNQAVAANLSPEAALLAPTGRAYLAFHAGYNADAPPKPRLKFEFAIGTFAVGLSSDGGSAGTQAAACTYTYTATYRGQTLGTGLSPLFAGRGQQGAMVAATAGLMNCDAGTGGLSLEVAYERPATTDDCSE